MYTYIFGSAFTIMAFNNDISISGVFEHFYKQIMGVDKPQVSVLEVFYCIGLAVGIILFLIISESVSYPMMSHRFRWRWISIIRIRGTQ